MLIVDSKEPYSYRKRGDKVKNLRWGDGWIIKSESIIKIERKLIPDLYKSLQDDRLNQQLAHVDILIVVDEDTFMPRGIFDTLYSDNRLVKILNKISEHTVVKYVKGIDGYFNELRRIETRMEKGEYALLRVRRQIDNTYNDSRIAMLSSLPSIGSERAKVLIETYGSVRNTLNHVEKWNTDVNGIGIKVVNKVIDFLVDGEREESDKEVNNMDVIYKKRKKEKEVEKAHPMVGKHVEFIDNNLKQRIGEVSKVMSSWVSIKLKPAGRVRVKKDNVLYRVTPKNKYPVEWE